jgi:integrase
VTFGKRGKATIYGKSKTCRLYRVAGYAKGKRQITYHADYPAALAKAEELAKSINEGSNALALSPAQAEDALLALDVLAAHKRQSGEEVSLHAAVAEWAAAAAKLGQRPLHEAVDTFLSTAADLKPITVKDAVEEFLASRAHKATAAAGKRAQLSPGYAYNVAMWLREFAETFTAHQLAELTAKLLSAYMSAHRKVTPRTRNARRNVVKMFLRWAMRANYLPQSCRLLEADALATELEEGGTIEFYQPAELAAILQGAHDQADYRHLLPVLAINALAGVRLAECVRLEWSDVFAVAGHVTVDKSKSKTRARRLVPICASLALWLEPFRASAGPLWTFGLEKFHADFNALLAGLEIAPKRNGGRHGFATFRFALTQNENQVAAEMGNSPDMVHGHYRGLATNEEALRWFAVAPAPVAGNVVSISAAVA